ncbi:hypothetical protein ANCDUO_04651 [Ancylostoma duodenale]|uniref:Uncharacterized protein n=1 Tax=Ancylostoma duodenale TaxID=51022 RepID=A0A0C2GUE6_9BILA|nr:hypothetical protein ANCDUO_04651 [Ancylostoma duodenale]
MQNAQHTPGTMQVHQMSSSCEIVQHASEIQQQQQPGYTQTMLDMSGSSAGTIGDMLQSRDALVPGESLDVSQGDNSYSTIPDAAMIEPMLDGEMRTFGITQVPPPPRNDSEATVPARTSPNSCSPGLIGGDDETGSLIPTIFYSNTQNDMSDLSIQDSPVEKGLNCQHFRFDIILAMKHHRIGKEDYERTLQELDQMEKEKCVGPLGDMLMRRLGLKRQPQQSHGGKFSVDELVAAFAANAKIRERGEKLPERRDSSELFSEFLNEITPSGSAPLDPFSAGAASVLSTVTPLAQQLPKPSILQSGDANDLGFLLSDDVIAEFDSMSKAAKQVQKPASVGEPSSSALSYKQPLSAGSPPRRKDASFLSPSSPTKPGSQFLSSSASQKTIETPPLAEDRVFPSSPVQTPLSFGQPAAAARRSPDVLFGQLTSKVAPVTTNVRPALPPDSSKGTASATVSSSVASTVFPSSIAPKKAVLGTNETEEKSAIIGAPAAQARRSDVFPNAEYEDLSPVSPVVISPEPLSDEPEWWQRDEKTPPMLNTSVTTASSSVPGSDSLIHHSIEDPKPAPKRDEETINVEKRHPSVKVEELCSKQKSRSPEHVDEKKSTRVSEELDSSALPRSVRLRSSDGEEDEPSTSKANDLYTKKPPKKSNRYLFGSDSSSDESTKGEVSAVTSAGSRLHQTTSHSSLSLITGHSRKSRSPQSHHSTSPRSSKKKSKKSSVPPKQVKEVKEPVSRSSLSKVELSRELLARQISEIIEEERNKLPPEEARQLRRPLSPATLDVVIQDLMQHHISEDTSPNRELFASKLLGTDLFSKLFFRAGKCVFRHYEELDDLSRKEKGRGSCQSRRKGATSRKRDTELLRGIRKSREIQKYRDAVRAAKEPSEAEKAAAAERAKLEAMPWLARSAFKPDVQQGSSTRFVIPKKSSTSSSGARQSSDPPRDSSGTKYRDSSHHSDVDVKPPRPKVEDPSSEYHKHASQVEKIVPARRSRSPPGHSTKIVHKTHDERVPKSFEHKSPVAKFEETSSSFSFTWVPRSGSQKSKVKHTWPLKRWRSTSAFIQEPAELPSEHYTEEPVRHESACVGVLGVTDAGVNSFAEVGFEKQPPAAESHVPLTTAECASATEAELAALALQEELSRSEQGSPDDQFDALRYLAAMPESEFQVASENMESKSSSAVAQQEHLAPPVEGSKCPPIPPKLFSPDRARLDENQFDQMDWIRMEHVSQPFFPSDYETDPWRLPLSAGDSLTPKHVLESPQTATAPPGPASLYSSLQEELDTIVRDTLGETIYTAPSEKAAPKPASGTSERFDWPKADVPVRSYAPDIVLPNLSCDKSKIAILDMCRCKRCMTKCVYFCDDEEWKYLYDCAVSRRKERERADLAKQHRAEEVCSVTRDFLKKPEHYHEKMRWPVYSRISYSQTAKIRVREESCSTTQNFLKRSARAHAEYCWYEYQRAFERRSAKFGPIERICSTTQNFLRRSDRCRVEHCWCMIQRTSDSQSMSVVCAPPGSCEFFREAATQSVNAIKYIYQRASDECSFSLESSNRLCVMEGKPFKEETSVLWPEFQHAFDRVYFNICGKPRDIVLNKKSERSSSRIVLPIHQRILIRCSMSLFSSPLIVDLYREESAADRHLLVPVPINESEHLSVSEISQSKMKTDARRAARANINVPRLSSASMSVAFTGAGFDTPWWILRNALQTASVAVPYPRVEATNLSVCQLNVRRKRAPFSLTDGTTLPVPREASTALTHYSSTPGFLRRGPRIPCELSLPLPVCDSTSYALSVLRVRRKRAGISDVAEIALPIPRLEAELLNVTEVTIERKRRASSARIAISITIPRLNTTALNICDTVVENSREGMLETVCGSMPLPRMEYAILNDFKLTVKRKRVGATFCSETVVDIPREDAASFSVVDIIVDRTFPDSAAVSEIDVPIPREEDTILRALELRVKRRRRPFLEGTERVQPIPREEDARLNILELNARRQRAFDELYTKYDHPIPRHSEAIFSIVDRVFKFTNTEAPNIEAGHTVDIPSEEDWSTHISTIKVRRNRKQQSSHLTHVETYSDFDNFGLSNFEIKDSLTRKREPGELDKDSATVVNIPRVDAECLRVSTLRTSRKRKHAEEATIFVKRLALEDRADLFLTEKSFYSDANRFTEVVYIKDPRLPEQCEKSFMEVSRKWRKLAHQHLPTVSSSSYLVTQLATLLQRVFCGAIDRGTINMKDLVHLLKNTDGRYDIDIFTNPQKVLTSESVTPGPLWDRLMKLRMQRNSTEILSRKLLSPLYLFLGIPNVPRVGKPWRKWLKPLEQTSDSRIGWQLALCMRVPDLVGVDDMDCKLQAIKMWWTIMILKGTIPWSLYPCFSRRQLFILVRLLEAVQDVERPPFSLYPPRAFFKAVKKILRHPRIELIPKDIYHPDVTVMATLLKVKPNRVFQVDRSLPELLCHWLDDMNKIDAYLASDVDITPIPQSRFLTMTEWAWANYNQGCAPDWIEYDRTVSLDETVEKLIGCLKDVALPLEQRRRISMLKSALLTFSKFENGPDLDQVPIDIINPFALSASLISKIPMPEGFVDDCFVFLEEVISRDSRISRTDWFKVLYFIGCEKVKPVTPKSTKKKHKKLTKLEMETKRKYVERSPLLHFIFLFHCVFPPRMLMLRKLSYSISRAGLRWQAYKRWHKGQWQNDD